MLIDDIVHVLLDLILRGKRRKDTPDFFASSCAYCSPTTSVTAVNVPSTRVLILLLLLLRSVIRLLHLLKLLRVRQLICPRPRTFKSLNSNRPIIIYFLKAVKMSF